MMENNLSSPISIYERKQQATEEPTSPAKEIKKLNKVKADILVKMNPAWWEVGENERR